MRLKSHIFLGLAMLFGANAAQAQPGGYEPPPVDYADAAEPVRPQPSRVPPPGELGSPATGPDEMGPPSAAPPRRLRVDLGGYVEAQGGISAELAGGMRIENQYLVTRTGVENLTPFPLELA